MTQRVTAASTPHHPRRAGSRVSPSFGQSPSPRDSHNVRAAVQSSGERGPGLVSIRSRVPRTRCAHRAQCGHGRASGLRGSPPHTPRGRCPSAIPLRASRNRRGHHAPSGFLQRWGRCRCRGRCTRKGKAVRVRLFQRNEPSRKVSRRLL